MWDTIVWSLDNKKITHETKIEFKWVLSSKTKSRFFFIKCQSDPTNQPAVQVYIWVVVNTILRIQKNKPLIKCTKS